MTSDGTRQFPRASRSRRPRDASDMTDNDNAQAKTTNSAVNEND